MTRRRFSGITCQVRWSTNEPVDHVPADLLAQFRQTGQLPATIAHQILAHGISTAFQLAAAFAALALAVALVVIQPRPATAEAATGPDNRQLTGPLGGTRYSAHVWPCQRPGGRGFPSWPIDSSSAYWPKSSSTVIVRS